MVLYFGAQNRDSGLESLEFRVESETRPQLQGNCAINHSPISTFNSPLHKKSILHNSKETFTFAVLKI